MSNGNIIGPDNTPTIAGASGLWEPDDLYEARLLADWPFVVGGYSIHVSQVTGQRRQAWRISETTDTVTLDSLGPAVGTNVDEGVQGGVFSSDSTGYLIRLGQIMDTMSFATSTVTIGANGSGFPAGTTQRYFAGTCQSLTDGYAFGGRAAGIFNDSYRWEFSTGARSDLGFVGLAINLNAGTNSATKAYSLGGQSAFPQTVSRDDILSMPFATETWATLAAVISSAGNTGTNRTATSATDAYVQYTRSGPTSFFDRFTFSTEAISTLTPLSPFLGSWSDFIYSSPTRAAIRTAWDRFTTTVRFVDFSTEAYSAGSLTYSGPNDESPTSTGFVKGGWFSQI